MDRPGEVLNLALDQDSLVTLRLDSAQPVTDAFAATCPGRAITLSSPPSGIRTRPSNHARFEMPSKKMRNSDGADDRARRGCVP